MLSRPASFALVALALALVAVDAQDPAALMALGRTEFVHTAKFKQCCQMKAGSGTLTPQMAAECKEITGYKDGWENLETGILLAQKHHPLGRIKGMLKRVNSKYGWNDASATEAIIAKLRLHGHTGDADRISASVAPAPGAAAGGLSDLLAAADAIAGA